MEDKIKYIIGRSIGFTTTRKDELTYRPIISPTGIGIRILIISFIFVTALTGFKIIPKFSWGFYNSEFFKNVLVEAHGMLFDLLVIGVVTLWLNIRRDKQHQLQIAIQRYMDEIIDFKNWKSEEASHRVAANLHRLARAGYYVTSLAGYYLRNANLADANLERADLSGANLTNADLRCANLAKAKLTDTNLHNARYDIHTKLPKEFRPQDHGMRLIGES